MKEIEMASRSDGSQAAALSRALRKAGWNPISSDSPRRYEAGLRVQRGILGLGASVMLQANSARRLTAWVADMASDLEQLGYACDASGEPEGDFENGYWFMFRNVKKTEKKASGS